MRERVEALVGGVSRAMWVMTFHSACARILRAEAPAARLQARLHDLRRGRLAADGQALHRRSSSSTRSATRRGRSRPRSPPPRTSSSTRRTTATRPGLLVRARRSPTSTACTSGGCSRPSAMDFDDLLVRTVNLLELFERRPREVPPDLPLGAGRRVSGHQPRPVPAPPAARPRSTRNLFVVGDDFQSRLLVPRTPTSATSSSSSATSPRPRRCCWSRTTARHRRSSTPPTR